MKGLIVESEPDGHTEEIKPFERLREEGFERHLETRIIFEDKNRFTDINFFLFKF